MEKAAERRLWDCYEDFEEFMIDCSMDLAWDDKSRDRQIAIILKDERFPTLRAAVREKFRYNLILE
jgi:hypothetical protein